ncbi:hypothetical protein D3C72_2054130 [compost metagenome]
MRHADQQLLALQPVQGFAQRAAADAVDARQFGFGNLAARGDLAFDDGGLDLAEDVVRQRFAVVRRRARQGEHFAHGVDNPSVFMGCERGKMRLAH